MKRQIILSFVCALCCFVNLTAQDLSTKRETPAADVENQRKGEATDYQKLLRRFETAYKEGDLSSVIDLKEDLVATMQKRVDLLAAQPVKTDQLTEELKQQETILLQVKNHDYSTMTRENSSSMDQIKLLQEFGRLMARNFAEQ